MSMSKKDFIALADMIRAHNREMEGEHDGEQFRGVHLLALAEFCREQNPNFMRERWLGYIQGVNGKNGGRVHDS